MGMDDRDLVKSKRFTLRVQQAKTLLLLQFPPSVRSVQSVIKVNGGI
jgi:hypothetical protein